METTRVRVETRRMVAANVVELVLSDENGKLLPGSTAGAHIDLHVAPGLVRAYSLVEPSGGAPVSRYVIAVALAPDSRGGSRQIHEALQAGASVDIGTPRNHFALADDPSPVRLIAGGIGVTPLLAMARERAAQGRPWRMVYAARSQADAAYLPELEALEGCVSTHFDQARGGPPDLAEALAGLAPDERIYCCGPAALMAAVREQAIALGHPVDRLHFESFGAGSATGRSSDEGDQTGASADQPFVVHLAQRGIDVAVATGQSLLDALEAMDVIVPSVCREGVCGSCECTVLEGTPDHRDAILSETERQEGRSMMVCVSRARTERLVLDL